MKKQFQATKMDSIDKKPEQEAIRLALNNNTSYRVYCKLFKVYLTLITGGTVLLFIFGVSSLSNPYTVAGGVRRDRHTRQFFRAVLPIIMAVVVYLIIKVAVGWIGVYSLNTKWMKGWIGMDIFESILVILGAVIPGEYTKLWGLLIGFTSIALAIGIIKQVNKTVEYIRNSDHSRMAV